MSYKLLVLAPSAGGKSTLMRYLRKNSDLVVVEIDEEIMKANNNTWPTDEEYNKLIPQITAEVISRENIIFFMKDIPIELVKQAKQSGFKVVLLKLTLEQLLGRNKNRMLEEGYEDASMWFKDQLEELDIIGQEGLVDMIIDGNLDTEEIAKEITSVCRR